MIMVLYRAKRSQRGEAQEEERDNNIQIKSIKSKRHITWKLLLFYWENNT